MLGHEYDYVIIGAGSAGCVLAKRLGENPALRILVLESGPPDASWTIDMPSAVGIVVGGTRFNWRYSSEPEPGLDGRRIGTPRGRTWAVPRRSTAWSTSAAMPATMTAGPSTAARAGATARCCRTSSVRKTTGTAPTATGAGPGCSTSPQAIRRHRCARPSSKPDSKPATARAATSMATARKASARSTAPPATANVGALLAATWPKRSKAATSRSPPRR